MSLLAFALLAQSIVSQQASAAAQPATPVLLPGVVRTELAGISMSAAPHFDFVTSFVEGGPMQIAVDPVRHPQIVGANAYLYIVRHKTPEQWLADPTLVEVRSAAQAVFFPGPDIQNCTVAVQFGPVPGNNGVQFGVDYFPRTRGVSTLSSPSVIVKILREAFALRSALNSLDSAT